MLCKAWLAAALLGFTASAVATPYATEPTAELEYAPKYDSYKKPVHKYGNGETNHLPSVKRSYYSGTNPRKCTQTGDRCAGAPDMPYVEYAPCCEDTMSCVQDASYTWGYVCVEVSEDEKMCTSDGAKCMGTKNEEYVPFSSCCGGGTCVEDKSMGPGKYCNGGTKYDFYGANSGAESTAGPGEDAQHTKPVNAPKSAAPAYKEKPKQDIHLYHIAH